MKSLNLFMSLVVFMTSMGTYASEIDVSSRLKVLNLLAEVETGEALIEQSGLTPAEVVEVLKDAKIIDDQFVEAVRANPELAMQGQLTLPEGNSFGIFGVWAVMSICAAAVGIAVAVGALG